MENKETKTGKALTVEIKFEGEKTISKEYDIVGFYKENPKEIIGHLIKALEVVIGASYDKKDRKEFMKCYMSAYGKKYYKENYEKMHQYAVAYRNEPENKEKMRQYCQEYYQSKADHVKSVASAYYKANREVILQKQREKAAKIKSEKKKVRE